MILKKLLKTPRVAKKLPSINGIGLPVAITTRVMIEADVMITIPDPNPKQINSSIRRPYANGVVYLDPDSNIRPTQTYRLELL